jgi:hypothetical protein
LFVVIINLLGHGDFTPNQCPRKLVPLYYYIKYQER